MRNYGRKREFDVSSSNRGEKLRRSIRRCIAIAKRGNLGKAARVLGASGIHEENTDTLRVLEEKNPQTGEQASARFKHDQPDVIFARFSRREAKAVLKKTKKALGAGGTGLNFDLHEKLSQRQQRHSHSSSQVCIHCRRGKLCPKLAPWFASAPLVLLKKEDDGLRTVAVGDTLRRLGKLLMWRVRKKAMDLLYLLQLGIGVTSPAEALNHALHNILQAKSVSDELGLLKVDLEMPSTW